MNGPSSIQNNIVWASMKPGPKASYLLYHPVTQTIQINHSNGSGVFGSHSTGPVQVVSATWHGRRRGSRSWDGTWFYVGGDESGGDEAHREQRHGYVATIFYTTWNLCYSNYLESPLNKKHLQSTVQKPQTFGRSLLPTTKAVQEKKGILTTS